MASEIDFEELNEKKDELIILDVRSPGELESTGHIPGAKNIPLPELEEALQLEDEAFEEKYGFEKPQEGVTIVSHCLKGGRARRAADLMAAAGWAVRVYVGSFDDWQANGGDINPGKP